MFSCRIPALPLWTLRDALAGANFARAVAFSFSFHTLVQEHRNLSLEEALPCLSPLFSTIFTSPFTHLFLFLFSHFSSGGSVLLPGVKPNHSEKSGEQAHIYLFVHLFVFSRLCQLKKLQAQAASSGPAHLQMGQKTPGGAQTALCITCPRSLGDAAPLQWGGFNLNTKLTRIPGFSLVPTDPAGGADLPLFIFHHSASKRFK